GPAVVLEFATSFGSVAVPGGVGTTVFIIRFLQRLGVDVATGVTVTVTSNAMSGLIQVLLFVVCLPFASSKFSLGKLPSNWPVWILLAVLVVALIVAALFGIPALRRRVLPVLGRSKAFAVEFIRSPRRLFMNFTGNLGSALLSVTCLALCLHAFGGSVPFVTLIVINIGVSTISNMIPVPGGLGVGALGLTGALVALGVPQEIAVPAVLTQQLLVIWLPVLPGWFCTQALMRREYL
ncbi:MAG: lysylphosphatidylglycerol synthase transmembrane domain-containing protein, partial [Acidimicrobiia bacterium]